MKKPFYCKSKKDNITSGDCLECFYFDECEYPIRETSLMQYLALTFIVIVCWFGVYGIVKLIESIFC